MVFEILTDKEINRRARRKAIRQRNCYAANLLRWEAEERSQPMAKPVQSPFVRCTDARVMLGDRSIHERCERAGWLTPVRRGKRLTLFKPDDIEAAQLRVSWGEIALNWFHSVRRLPGSHSGQSSKKRRLRTLIRGVANPLSDKSLRCVAANLVPLSV